MARLSPVFGRALTILLIAGVVAGSSGLHLSDRDDPFCDIGPIHDPSAHRIGAGRDHSSSAPAHCFLCHWQRSFRTMLVASDAVDLSIDGACEIAAANLPHYARVFDRSLPARAPPA